MKYAICRDPRGFEGWLRAGAAYLVQPIACGVVRVWTDDVTFLCAASRFR